MKSVMRVVAIPSVLICALLSTDINAASIDANLYIKGFSEISYELHDLMHYTSNELCTGDLDVASAYVDSAQMSLMRDKIPEALMSADKGIQELSEISTNRVYCHSIAQKSKRVLADLIRTRGEVDAFMHLKLKS